MTKKRRRETADSGNKREQVNGVVSPLVRFASKLKKRRKKSEWVFRGVSEKEVGKRSGR